MRISEFLGTESGWMSVEVAINARALVLVRRAHLTHDLPADWLHV